MNWVVRAFLGVLHRSADMDEEDDTSLLPTSGSTVDIVVQV
jgi:hypothetical protein